MDQESFKKEFDRLMPNHQHNRMAFQQLLLAKFGEDGREKFNETQNIVDQVMERAIDQLLSGKLE